MAHPPKSNSGWLSYSFLYSSPPFLGYICTSLSYPYSHTVPRCLHNSSMSTNSLPTILSSSGWVCLKYYSGCYALYYRHYPADQHGRDSLHQKVHLILFHAYHYKPYFIPLFYSKAHQPEYFLHFLREYLFSVFRWQHKIE